MKGITYKGVVYNKILKKLVEIRHYKPQGSPKYTSTMVIFFLLLRYTFCETYKLPLEQQLLRSLCLLKIITSGTVDSVKTTKRLFK